MQQPVINPQPMMPAAFTPQQQLALYQVSLLINEVMNLSYD